MSITFGNTALVDDYTIKVAPFWDILGKTVLESYIFFSLLDIGFN